MRAITALIPVASLAALAFALPARADAGRHDLDHRIAQTVWPADLAALADQCLQDADGTRCSVDAAQLRNQAHYTMAVLREKSVRLQRAAFLESGLSDAWNSELHAAALGDAKAAARLASAYDPARGQLPNPYRYLGWLEYAAALGNEQAAYQLAVYFRGTGEASRAAIYETRAVAAGFVMPYALDNVRK